MLTLPSKPKIIKSEDNKATFEIEACYPGYGTTLGNSLRRVLLSSLPGVAITGVKIKGVQHEFSTIPHISENVVQIILNLKQIRFKLHTDKPVTATLKAKGEQEIKAEKIKTGSLLEIINKDAHIAFLNDKKAELEMEIEVEPGLGYLPTEERKKNKLEVGKIAIDAIFSPVRKVNYSIDNMRVGERTDYDKLKINIETDGTISPKDAFLKASKILVDHFKIFTLIQENKKESKKIVSVKKEKKVKKDKKNKVEKTEKEIVKIKIEDLNLSPRVTSSLVAAKIKTVGGLIRKSENDLKELEGLGKKGITEIRRSLGKFGLTLKK